MLVVCEMLLAMFVTGCLKVLSWLLRLVEKKNNHGDRCFDLSSAPFIFPSPLPRSIQFHYTNWYDHDIPDDASAQTEIINFLRLVREEQPPSPSSSSSSLSSSSTSSSSLPPIPPPILVHCSAGCGRTGTLIAIDYVWSLLKRGGIRHDLDLFKIVRFMR